MIQSERIAARQDPPIRPVQRKGLMHLGRASQTVLRRVETPDGWLSRMFPALAETARQFAVGHDKEGDSGRDHDMKEV